MDDLFLALLLISILALVFGLIQPKLFSKIFKKRTNRKTVGLVFCSAIILFFILFGVTSETSMSFDKVTSPTNQSPVTLSASKAYKNAKIDFYQEGTKTQELMSDGNGKFSVKVDLKEGGNKFKATATNEKGRSKTSSEINIIYDKTPPTLVLSQTKIETGSDKAEISGETEKNSTLTLWVNDKEIGNTIAKDSKFKFNVTNLKNGENKYIIKVTDEANNIGEQKEVVVIYTPKVETPKSTEQPKTEEPKPTETSTPAPQTDNQNIAPISGETISQKNAVKKAKSYLDYSAFSHDGLVAQLEYEQFSHADAVYGADNSGANWNEQAAKKAKQYMEYSAFSRGSLIEQLKYEKFTQEQAEYGANAVGL